MDQPLKLYFHSKSLNPLSTQWWGQMGLTEDATSYPFLRMQKNNNNKIRERKKRRKEEKLSGKKDIDYHESKYAVYENV